MDILSNWFFWIFFGFYLLYLIVEIGLDILNMRYADEHKNKIPKPFVEVYSDTEYKKSIRYAKEKTRFRIFSLLSKSVLLFLFIVTGFFGALDHWLQGLIAPNFLRAVIYPFVVFGILFLFELPQNYYYQFVIEEKFGFNRMNRKTFFLDQVKIIGLGLLFGIPLFSALLWIIDSAGHFWWFYGFLLIMGFQLFTAAIYPVLLAPIFNKFTPLPEGELKKDIEQLANRLDFKMSGIFTIDGSKRSSHSNAFFAGLSAMRRIVLFDTLVEKHTNHEIVSVIAHEIGHNNKKHIQKTLLLSSIITLLLFYVLALCLKWPLFFTGLGANEPSVHVGLVLFFIFSSIFLFPITPLFTKLSRKNEFEADEFAVIVTKDKEELKSALIKLTKENLGLLTPHPMYSAYHYSHPTTLERVAAIDAIEVNPL